MQNKVAWIKYGNLIYLFLLLFLCLNVSFCICRILSNLALYLYDLVLVVLHPLYHLYIGVKYFKK